MGNKSIALFTLFAAVAVGIFSFYYIAPVERMPANDKSSRVIEKSRNETVTPPVRDFSGAEISNLENGVTVRFPAYLVRDSDSSCIYLFAGDEYEKYDGDSKWAIRSIMASEADSSYFINRDGEAIVTGRMTFVRDAADTSRTCNIIAGNLFEITDLEYK